MKKIIVMIMFCFIIATCIPAIVFAAYGEISEISYDESIPDGWVIISENENKQTYTIENLNGATYGVEVKIASGQPIPFGWEVVDYSDDNKVIIKNLNGGFGETRIISFDDEIPEGWLIIDKNEKLKTYKIQNLNGVDNGGPFGEEIEIVPGQSIPLGWGIVRYKDGDQKMLIKNIKEVNFGTKLYVRQGYSLPDGWVTIFESTEDSESKEYIVEYINGAPKGTEIIVVYGSSIPNGWKVINDDKVLRTLTIKCEISNNSPTPKPTSFPEKIYPSKTPYIRFVDLDTLDGDSSYAMRINNKGQVIGGITLDGNNYAFLWENGEMNIIGSFNPIQMNDNGQVIGWLQTSNGQWHACLWENGTTTDLGTLGGEYSYAYQINNKGQIIGTSATANGKEHAFLWENGKMIDLNTLGSESSYPSRINSKGQIVGTFQTSNGKAHACLWENGFMIDLGTLGGHYSSAFEINNYGQIIGNSTLPNGENHGFLWENGIMTDLGTIGEANSYVCKINDRGQIWGYTPTSNGEGHMLLWEYGIMKDLGSFGGDSWASFINSKGQFVGYTFTENRQKRQAFFWENGFIIDLDAIGEHSWAEAINDRGQIIGEYETSDGKTHACMWEFTDSPSVTPTITPTTTLTPTDMHTPTATPTPIHTVLPKELLPNTSFDFDTKNWNLCTQGFAEANYSRDTVNYDSPPASCRVNIVNQGTHINDIQLYTNGINVESGKKYKLTVKAKSDGGIITPLVYLMKDSEPWTTYTAEKIFEIGNKWSTYKTIIIPNSTDSNARLTFCLGNKAEENSTLYFDSLSLKEVTMLEVNLNLKTEGKGSVYDWTNDSIKSYPIGSTVTLTAKAAEGSSFLYWKDSSGRVLSENPEYTFCIGSNETLTAIFAAKDKHLVTFKNGNGETIHSIYITDGCEITFPRDPSMYGYTFIGWDKTADEIRAATSDILVTALFKKVESKLKITVNNGIGSGEYFMKDYVTVVANTPESNKKFSHWVDNSGNILCYNTTYRFYATRNVNITAVFVPIDDKIEQKASIAITSTSKTDGKLSFVAERVVPEGNKIISHGIIVTNNPSIGSSETSLIIGEKDVLKASSITKGLIGTFILNKIVSQDEMWYARGYVIYMNNNGEVFTVYSCVTKQIYILSTTYGDI